MTAFDTDYQRIKAHSDPETVAAFDQIAAAAEGEDLADWAQPIDWPAFWSAEQPDTEWLVEPIIPTGRQVATYSAPKQGKSLIALDAVAARCTGRSCFGCPPLPPIDVVYLDLEMTADDLRERLDDLGYTADDDLSRLHYFQLVSLPPLDSDLGGQVLEAIVRRFDASLVVCDTMARVVAGDENAADTYRNFYRHSGRRLKAMGVALWRLDHAGKDATQGQRGSSEKAGDVDVVFRLSASAGQVTLKRTHSRIPWVADEVILRREEEPRLVHVLADEPVDLAVLAVIRELDALGVDPNGTVTAAQAALRQAGHGRRKGLVVSAQKRRRARR